MICALTVLHLLAERFPGQFVSRITFVVYIQCIEMAECALGAGTEHSGVSVAMRLSTAQQPAARSPAGAMLLYAPGKLAFMHDSLGIFSGSCCLPVFSHQQPPGKHV